MLSKTYIVSLLLAAAGSVAARPDIQLYSTRDCPAGGETTTFGPIPTDRCQQISNSVVSFGAKVRGPYPAGCTYRFFANSDCSSQNFIDNPQPNICFHVIDNQPVGSVLLIGGTACNA